jgi:hypothetical protein
MINTGQTKILLDQFLKLNPGFLSAEAEHSNYHESGSHSQSAAGG